MKIQDNRHGRLPDCAAVRRYREFALLQTETFHARLEYQRAGVNCGYIARRFLTDGFRYGAGA